MIRVTKPPTIIPISAPVLILDRTLDKKTVRRNTKLHNKRLKLNQIHLNLKSKNIFLISQKLNIHTIARIAITETIISIHHPPPAHKRPKNRKNQMKEMYLKRKNVKNSEFNERKKKT